MGISSSCAWQIVAPTCAVVVAALIGLFCYKKGLMDYWHQKSTQNLVKFAEVIGSVFTIYQIIRYWHLLNSGFPLQTTFPSGFGSFDNRCIPLFRAVPGFQAKYPNTSAVYSQDKDSSSLRLCTDASAAVVFSAFSEFNNSNTFFNPGFPTSSDMIGCRLEDIVLNCKTVDYDDNKLTVMPCAQLLKTPPLPNGFVYKTTIDSVTNCVVTFAVHRNIANCNYSHVYQIDSVATANQARILFAFPFTFLVIAIMIGVYMSCVRNRKEPLNGIEDFLHDFAMQSELGAVYNQCGGPDSCCADLRSATSTRNPFGFFILLIGRVLEIFGYIYAWVNGCNVCDYVDIYYMLLIKCGFTAFFVYDFSSVVCCDTEQHGQTSVTKAAEEAQRARLETDS